MSRPSGSRPRYQIQGRATHLGWFPDGFWLTDYVPEVDWNLFPTIEKISEILGPVKVEPIPIPNDCTDGFLCAYWARPEAYVTGGVIVYKNRRFENVPAKKGRRCRKQAAEQAAQDSIWSFMR
jgi:hypothetical protein